MKKIKLTERQLSRLSQKFHTVGFTAEEYELYYVLVYEWEHSNENIVEFSEDDKVPTLKFLEGDLLLDELKF